MSDALDLVRCVELRVLLGGYDLFTCFTCSADEAPRKAQAMAALAAGHGSVVGAEDGRYLDCTGRLYHN